MEMKNFSRSITQAEYVAHARQLRLTLSDGCQLVIPVDRLQFEHWDGTTFQNSPRPTDESLATVKVWGGGSSVFFPDCEEVFMLEDLEVGWYGDHVWMESLMVSA